MIPIQPDCDNCEYQDEDGRCTAFVESTFFDPLPCEEQEVERMTREEAIKELEEDKALYMPEEWIESLDRDTPDGRLITALDMAIKALEQESVLDKIRAEIMELQTYKMFEGENTVYSERDDILEIIDKYTAESEE